MRTTSNPLRPCGLRRNAARALALTTTGALALVTVGLSPASAATVAWDPTAVGLDVLPQTSVDGEVTVTQVTGSAGTMKSFVEQAERQEMARWFGEKPRLQDGSVEEGIQEKPGKKSIPVRRWSTTS